MSSGHSVSAAAPDAEAEEDADADTDSIAVGAEGADASENTGAAELELVETAGLPIGGSLVDAGSLHPTSKPRSHTCRTFIAYQRNTVACT
ncbi:MAG: hypothetical protein BWY17_00174 [Deltaproteobacteria bacterium ADurb.Bin207]|jgi:hypothetical protein|nr:MAG: hypothetical protein BWY17_00174 [Deltaproteobacteria bacterium ADurb.Bin207]